MMHFFSPTAQENIKLTGNVWGHTTEYDFRFTVKIWRRVFKIEQRSTSNFLGRFGGGWSFKLGVQAGSFKKFLLLDDAIFNLFTMTIRVSRTA